MRNIAPNSHLIIVCCHGIWVGDDSRPPDADNDAAWLIASFQKDETSTFIEHLKAGLRLLAAKSEAGEECWLVISGGPTRRETTRSEAASYLLLAAVHHFWNILDAQPHLHSHILLEDRALDSFQNVLLSLHVFSTTTSSRVLSSPTDSDDNLQSDAEPPRPHRTRYPAHVTLISHAFKQPRFCELHMPALHWPTDGVAFVGIDPEYMQVDVKRAEEVRQGSLRDGYLPWGNDAYGVGEQLTAKRQGRDPWGTGLVDMELALGLVGRKTGEREWMFDWE